MNNGKKILMICSRSVTVAYFRMNLIRDLIANGYQVTVAALDRDRESQITATGAAFCCVGGNNRSMNPLKQAGQVRHYRQLIRDLKPDTVFTFQAVPNMLGGMACRFGRVPRQFAMVEGAGDVFAGTGFKWQLVRWVTCQLYRAGFRKAERVFFLNTDDSREFCRRKLVKKEQCAVIHGVGVDLDIFDYRPMKTDRVFIMVSRMLASKGLPEYCEAARITRKRYPEAVFRFLGEEFTMKQEDIREYLKDGSIEYLGYARDVRPHLEEASVFVLPSAYREGLPMTIMEAMATGRPVITTETVGCKGTVIEGETGWYAKMKDPEDLAKRFMTALKNREQLESMGRKARAYAEREFDVKVINRQILKILAEERGQDEKSNGGDVHLQRRKISEGADRQRTGSAGSQG